MSFYSPWVGSGPGTWFTVWTQDIVNMNSAHGLHSMIFIGMGGNTYAVEGNLHMSGKMLRQSQG